jgi:hypothetical protein
MTAVSSNGRLALALVAMLFSAVWPSNRAGGDQPKAYFLHIPSQSLEGALLEFTRQSGLQIIFFSALIHGQRSAELNGSYTIDAAMTALLAKSGLTFRVLNSRTVEVNPPRVAPAPQKH